MKNNILNLKGFNRSGGSGGGGLQINFEVKVVTFILCNPWRHIAYQLNYHLRTIISAEFDALSEKLCEMYGLHESVHPKFKFI